MFLFAYILCVKCNVLYIGGPSVHVRGGPNHLAPSLPRRHVRVQPRFAFNGQPW